MFAMENLCLAMPQCYVYGKFSCTAGTAAVSWCLIYCLMCSHFGVVSTHLLLV